MLRLLEAINPEYTSEPVLSFIQLSDFIWEFVGSSWPLFEVSVLHIPLSYFSIRLDFKTDEICEHLELMRSYGLERLLGRLIVLHAICGSTSAKHAVLEYDVLSECEYDDAEISLILGHLKKQHNRIEKEELLQFGKGNPIQRATYLSIYLNQSTGPFDFLERLIDVYSIDPSVLGMIDWDPLFKLIEQTSDFHYTPQIVALAAILSEERVLNHSTRVKQRYIPTGANTDFFNYARYCREELKMTPHKFFNSFAQLPNNVQSAIFEYMLSPGKMDAIANIFPSSKRIMNHADKSYTINALMIKLDCISYLKKREHIGPNDLRTIEESTRQRLRQIRYETDTSEGRIRLRTGKLASAILEYYHDHFSQVKFKAAREDDRQHELQSFLENRAYNTFSNGLAQHICFESRVAFDYLLSNLRHNFLRFKIESGIDTAFRSLGEQDLTQYKSAITATLDDYYLKWLTIYENRSFFKQLSSQINEKMQLSNTSQNSSPERLAQEIAETAKNLFDDLLAECRRVWMSEVRKEVIDIVKTELSCSEFRENTALLDAIETELGRVFEDAEGWLTVNNNPVNRSFGLRDLFLFESTNFSSASTRVRPLEVSCFFQPAKHVRPQLMSGDVMMPRYLFDAMVQLVQNLLENAFKHSFLPISRTTINIKIIQKYDKGVSIEFRNNFNKDDRMKMDERLKCFNDKISEARNAVLDAPLNVGGSGLRRIYFEFFSVFKDDFSLTASNMEFSKDIFLIKFNLPNRDGLQIE